MFFVAKICKRALRASIEGYLAVAASTPTYSSLTVNNLVLVHFDGGANIYFGANIDHN